MSMLKPMRLHNNCDQLSESLLENERTGFAAPASSEDRRDEGWRSQSLDEPRMRSDIERSSGHSHAKSFGGSTVSLP